MVLMAKRGEPITDPEKLEKVWQQAKYQLELEGFTITAEDEKAIKSVVSGKMSREKLIEDLKRGEANGKQI